MYRGESKCESTVKSTGKRCTNGAYYIFEEKLFCGVHSRFIKEREELPKNPNLKEYQKEIYEKHRKTIKPNKNGKSGNVILHKINPMKSEGLVSGYLNVFPNFKHQNKKTGFGCSSLSPMSVGPIDHGQPNLPVSLNLENFHQGNKVFAEEITEKGRIRRAFYKTREQFYQDSVPHRHKTTSGKKNIPLFSVWVDKEEIEHRISYIESRQFYCNFYERIVSELPDFIYLKKLVEKGYNLRICGYDSFDFEKYPEMSIEDHYLDKSKPFGQEAVLYTMLKEENWPWRKYKTFDF